MKRSDLGRFFDLSDAPLCVMAPDGTILAANDVLATLLGIEASDLSGRSLVELVHPDDRAGMTQRLHQLHPGPASATISSRCQARNGGWRSIAWTVRAPDRDGPLYAQGREETSPVEDCETLRLALDASPCGIILVDEHGTIRMANRATEALFGYYGGALVGRSVEVLVPATARESHLRHRAAFADEPSPRPMGANRDLIAVRRDGTAFPVEIGLCPFRTPKGMYVVGAIVDLTERKLAERVIAEQARKLKEANELLSAMAATDSLTGLANRRAFLEQLGFQAQLALRNARPLSVLFVDVDHFKAYNDEYGHLAGDDVLRQLAEILRQVARRSDFAARIGGEEFAIILPEADATGAVHLGERFRAGVAGATWPRRSMTVSIGATTASFAPSDTALHPDWQSQLLAAADRALYHSKENGRNRVTHTRELEPGD